MNFFNKYTLIEKIKKGSFGIVFKAKNNRTNELVAIKFEHKTEDIKTLKHEAKIYQYLGQLNGFPQLKMFGTNNNSNYLVMDLLGNSLINIIVYYKTLSLKTTLILGIQIIQRIQTLHEKYLLHRDIKPDNFVFGLGKNCNKLYLIDFGFSKRYDFDGTHIEEHKIKNIIGSPNYVSINTHNYIEPSRRDDIEASIYVILTMLLGKLNWNDKQINDILQLKKNIVFINEMPYFIKKMLNYIKSIKFKETPNYNHLITIMLDEFNNNKFIYDGIFEWN
jgi:casein kinase 1 alpha